MAVLVVFVLYSVFRIEYSILAYLLAFGVSIFGSIVENFDALEIYLRFISYYIYMRSGPCQANKYLLQLFPISLQIFPISLQIFMPSWKNPEFACTRTEFDIKGLGILRCLPYLHFQID